MRKFFAFPSKSEYLFAYVKKNIVFFTFFYKVFTSFLVLFFFAFPPFNKVFSAATLCRLLRFAHGWFILRRFALSILFP